MKDILIGFITGGLVVGLAAWYEWPVPVVCPVAELPAKTDPVSELLAVANGKGYSARVAADDRYAKGHYSWVDGHLFCSAYITYSGDSVVDITKHAATCDEAARAALAELWRTK